MATPPDPVAHGAPTGIREVLAEGYGEALSSLGETWLAGVPAAIASVASTALLVILLLPAALAAGVVGGIGAFLAGGAGLAGGLLLYLLFAVVAVVLSTAVLAPGMQGLYRAHWDHLREGGSLDLGDGARGMTASWSLNGFLTVLYAAQILGYLLLFVPGVVLEAAFAFVVPGMLVHGLPLGAAIRRSVAHFLRAPLWHTALALVDNVALLAIGTLVPVIGAVVALPLHARLHLRAYLDAFPAEEDDAPQP